MREPHQIGTLIREAPLPHQQPTRELKVQGKQLKLMTRRPESFKRLRHPLTDQPTPYGKAQLDKRRAANRRARAARKVNR